MKVVKNMDAEFFTPDYVKNIHFLDRRMRIGDSFDLFHRDIAAGSKKARFYYVGCYQRPEIVERIMAFLMRADKEQTAAAGTAREFVDRFIPLIETDVTNSFEHFITFVLSGPIGLVVEGFAEAILIDARTYPVRSVQEPDDDKVLHGAHEGFVETLLFNTALIRRRIRDPALTMDINKVGSRSKTDIVLCYLKGKADEKIIKNLKRRLDSIEVNTLAMSQESLAECLLPKQLYNPFPRVRYTERPEAAAASVAEGSVILLVDGSPEVMIVPTGFFDFLQGTNDFYFPPFVGTYLRLLRLIIFIMTILVIPTWYLLVHNPSFIPEPIKFIAIEKPNSVPVIVQLMIVEFVIDALKLASLTTPSSLSNSFSLIGALVLGQFSIAARWLVPEVVLYMAFVSITNFAQPSFELGYAFKISRIMILILTAAFNLWGFIAGQLIVFILIATTKTISGRSYLYPLIPFNFKALSSLLVRKRIGKDNN